MTEFNPYDSSSPPAQYTHNMFVTPAMASEWIGTKDVGNRRSSVPYIKVWTERYRLRKYLLSHQGIAFDWDGNLRDGKNRLTALASMVGTDFPGVWIPVTFGVDPSSFAIMDTGLARNAGQFIPAPYANEKAAAAKILLDFPLLKVPTRKVDNPDVFAVHDALPELAEAAKLSHEIYTASGINATSHTAVLTVILASGASRDLVTAWCEGLRTGAGLSIGDPRLALRNKWAVDGQQLSNGGRSARRDGLYYITRAWNAHAAGERLTKLQLPRGGVDDIPAVVIR